MEAPAGSSEERNLRKRATMGQAGSSTKRSPPEKAPKYHRMAASSEEDDTFEMSVAGGGAKNGRRRQTATAASSSKPPLLLSSSSEDDEAAVELFDASTDSTRLIPDDAEEIEVMGNGAPFHVRDVLPKESFMSITLQIFFPFLIAGLGMVGAGLVLDTVQVSFYSPCDVSTFYSLFHVS